MARGPAASPVAERRSGGSPTTLGCVGLKLAALAFAAIIFFASHTAAAELSAFVVSSNSSGTVAINGGDTTQPTTPFTFNWGDGSSTSGFFPQQHVYADTTRNYGVIITAHHADGTSPQVSVGVTFNPQAGITLTSMDPVTADTSGASAGGAQPAAIRFVNNNGFPVDLYWIDFSGNRVFYTTIPASSSIVQGTFSSHLWLLVRNGSGGTTTQGTGTLLGAYTAATNIGTAASAVFDTAIIGSSGSGATPSLIALNTTVAGPGTGTITANPRETNYTAGTAVTLTAAAASGSVFQGWSGACSGTAPTCQLVMDSTKNVTATFTLASSTTTYALTTSTTGAGSGAITRSNAGPAYAPGTVVTLTATPSAGSTFTGWSGACSGTTPTCQVTMDANKAVTATFTLAAAANFTLTTATAGTGTGAITQDKPGATHAAGTIVTLTSAANAGSTFTGWSGACSGAAPTCQVTMDANKTVTATFTLAAAATFTLTTATTGTGAGSISRDKPGATHAAGTIVTLTATANTGSIFGGWSGACSGTAPTCQVTMNANTSVTASFNLRSPGLDGAGYAEIAPTFNGSDGNLSYVRLGNSGTAAATFRIVVVGSPSGIQYGEGTFQVPANSSPQYSLAQILSAANAGSLTYGDTNYSLYVQGAGGNLSLQHVIYNDANGFFENVSVCKFVAGVNYSGLNSRLANIHTSLIPGYPAQIYIHNYSRSDATYNAAIYESVTGALMGTLLVTLRANSTYYVPFSWIEQQIGWAPSGNQYHANMAFVAVGSGSYAAEVGQYIFNQQLGAYVNMTSRCGL